MKLKPSVSFLKNIFFTPPRQCVVCGNKLQQGQEYICHDCYQQIWRIEAPYCQKCGRPLGGLQHCIQCQDESFYFLSARSWGVYTGVLREAIHIYKFSGKSYLGRWFVEQMLKDIDVDSLYPNYVLVPVPLHPRRLLTRGFNQATVLCEALARYCSLEWTDILYRKTNTPSQTTLNRERRYASVRNQFNVKKQVAKLHVGKKILLIDDVMTTGSTLNECCRELLEFGFKEVHVLTIATVMKP